MAIRACQTIQARGALFDPWYSNEDTICVTAKTQENAVNELRRIVNHVSDFCGGGAIPLAGAGSTCPVSEIVIENYAAYTSWIYYIWDSYNFIRTSDAMYFLW